MTEDPGTEWQAGQDDKAALKQAGINLVSVLTLEQIATYLMSAGHIPEDAYRRTMAYLESRAS